MAHIFIPIILCSPAPNHLFEYIASKPIMYETKRLSENKGGVALSQYIK